MNHLTQLNEKVAIKCNYPWQMALLAAIFEKHGLKPTNYMPNMFTAGYMLIKRVGDHYTNCMVDWGRENIDYEQISK
jgi:hypothetical protein